jgi:hypothetical protein
MPEDRAGRHFDGGVAAVNNLVMPQLTLHWRLASFETRSRLMPAALLERRTAPIQSK